MKNLELQDKGNSLASLATLYPEAFAMVAAANSRAGQWARCLELAGWKFADTSAGQSSAGNPVKRMGGPLAMVLGAALLLAQTGCQLPGMHGGPPGLPGLPGLPRVELPNSSGALLATGAGEGLGRTEAAQLVQNGKSVNAINADEAFGQ